MTSPISGDSPARRFAHGPVADPLGESLDADLLGGADGDDLPHRTVGAEQQRQGQHRVLHVEQAARDRRVEPLVGRGGVQVAVVFVQVEGKLAGRLRAVQKQQRAAPVYQVQPPRPACDGAL